MGNLKAKQEWGYAPEYVEAMWLMPQQDQPDDHVLGAGEAHSVQEFLEAVFAYVGLDWQKYVEIDPRYFRPTKVEVVLADPTKARDKLGWDPKVTFKELVRIMVDADMEAAGMEPPGEGKRILEEKFAGWHRWDTGVTAALNSERRGVE